MLSTNIVCLTGNLGTDPEFRTFDSGKCKAQFSLAFSTLEGGAEKCNWIYVECWNGNALAVQKYIGKGSRVCVTGSLKVETWQDSQGQIKSTTKIVADRIEFISTKKVNAGAPVEAGYAGGLAGDHHDELPY